MSENRYATFNKKSFTPLKFYPFKRFDRVVLSCLKMCGMIINEGPRQLKRVDSCDLVILNNTLNTV